MAPVVPLHTVPFGHWESDVQLPPGTGAVAQAPQLPAARLQYLLMHWESSPQAVPLANWPAGARHAVGKTFPSRSWHAAPGRAWAHASPKAGVQPVPAPWRALEKVMVSRDVQAAWVPYTIFTKSDEHELSCAQSADATSAAACAAVTVDVPDELPLAVPELLPDPLLAPDEPAPQLHAS